MKSIFIKIKKWIRRKYIIHKYKKNFNTGRPDINIISITYKDF